MTSAADEDGADGGSSARTRKTTRARDGPAPLELEESGRAARPRAAKLIGRVAFMLTEGAIAAARLCRASGDTLDLLMCNCR